MSKPRTKRESIFKMELDLLTPAPGWIETKRDLPPIDMWVLVFHEGLYSVAQLVRWDDDGLQWWNGEAWMGSPEMLDYWRHLPVSPSGEDGSV